MAANKDAKLKELIRELAAEYFQRESNRQSLITVTDVDVFAHGTRAKILVTVLPVEQEEAAVGFIHRQLGDFKEYFKERSKVQRIPFFEVAIDRGEKNRQRLDEIEKTI